MSCHITFRYRVVWWLSAHIESHNFLIDASESIEWDYSVGYEVVADTIQTSTTPSLDRQYELMQTLEHRLQNKFLTPFYSSAIKIKGDAYLYLAFSFTFN